ncbi:MAG: hypothetical protein VYC56_10290 [Actinomycetota bacterium]|nr:hypothetical protein [Actinomycetota bacterium]
MVVVVVVVGVVVVEGAVVVVMRAIVVVGTTVVAGTVVVDAVVGAGKSSPSPPQAPANNASAENRTGATTGTRMERVHHTCQPCAGRPVHRHHPA